MKFNFHIFIICLVQTVSTNLPFDGMQTALDILGIVNKYINIALNHLH